MKPIAPEWIGAKRRPRQDCCLVWLVWSCCCPAGPGESSSNAMDGSAPLPLAWPFRAPASCFSASWRLAILMAQNTELMRKDMPSRAETHIQNSAPGPPRWMAVPSRPHLRQDAPPGGEAGDDQKKNANFKIDECQERIPQPRYQCFIRSPVRWLKGYSKVASANIFMVQVWPLVFIADVH